MSVIVSGIMINPVGEPVANAQITLTAVTNSLTVLNSFSVTVKTDSVGAYRIQLEEGSYSITVAVNGRSRVYGAVTLDNTTGPSTLNQLLKQQIMESELTPDVILYFRQIQQQVANDLATIKVLENSATSAAESAGQSRDEARQYAANLAEALATAKSYRDSAGESAISAAGSAQQAHESESIVIANATAAALSEQNTFQYRNEAQSAATTAADDASTHAAELTAEKIKLQVKTDADRAELARVTSEQIKGSIDNTALQVAQQHSEALQAASDAESSKNSAAISAENAQSSATAAGEAKDAAANSAETAQQNTEASAADRGAAKGFRDEAEGFANQAQESASSIDIPALQADIDQKIDKSGGIMTGGLILHGDAIEPLEAVTKQQLDAKPVGGLPIGHSYIADTRTGLDAGEAPQDGQELSRALFPDFWAMLAAGKRTVITESEWQANPLKRDCFSSGDGNTTFRLPDKNGKSPGTVGALVGRGDGLKSAGSIGTIQMDAIRNITGGFGNIGGLSGISYALGVSASTGAFLATGGSGRTPSNNPSSQQVIGGNCDTLNFSAEKVVPTAEENRVLSFTGCWVIKLAGSAFNEGQINALELATQITLLNTQVARRKFTIMYPEGSSTAPYSYPLNTRRVYVNPFQGQIVKCIPEVLYNGVWGDPGWVYYYSEIASTVGMYGVRANQTDILTDIVVVSGNKAAIAASNVSGSPHNAATSPTIALPFRVKIHTID